MRAVPIAIVISGVIVLIAYPVVSLFLKATQARVVDSSASLFSSNEENNESVLDMFRKLERKIDNIDDKRPLLEIEEKGDILLTERHDFSIVHLNPSNQNHHQQEQLNQISSTKYQMQTLRKERNGILYQIIVKKSKNGQNKFVTLGQSEAANICSQFGTRENPGILLTIKTKAENDFISHWVYNQLNFMKEIWLSLKRRPGTTDFIWPDGQIIKPYNMTDAYNNWYEGEPNNNESNEADAEENCAEMRWPIRENSQWNDITCRAYKIVICQTQNKIQ